MECLWSVCQMGGSAVGSGASGWLVRASARSLSGRVVEVSFASFAAAAAFARRWSSGRLPGVCRGAAVRRARFGWAVSVPVA